MYYNVPGVAEMSRNDRRRLYGGPIHRV